MINNFIKNIIREETKKIFLYKSRVCKDCGNPAEAIHHLVYRWKPKEEDVEFLCERCHNKKKKSKSKIIIEDKIDYTKLSIINWKDEEFLKKIKSIDKQYFTIKDIKEIDKRTHSNISKSLKKFELINMIRTINKNSIPMVYELVG